jgi:ribosome biogenesis GTPase / thiamine phosphate phosphatase
MGKRSKKAPPPSSSNLPIGRVIGRLGPVFSVEYNGDDISCIARGKAKTAVVGDLVRFEPDADTDLASGLLVKIEPRSSLLQRTDALGRRPQFIAANLTQIVIVCAAEPPLREGLIDRYIIAARLEGLKATILFNKTDLLDQNALEHYQSRLGCYETSGHPVHFGTCATPSGLGTLHEALDNEISILVGHSGVGKTSVINQLLPDYDGRTNVLSAASNKGQHTTTASLLHRLPTGGELIDTPGIRSFGLYGVTRLTLANHFPDFDVVQTECRFNNCTHQHEPKCAVIDHVESGIIAESRYEAYLKLLESTED